jgi:hypothetical protein
MVTPATSYQVLALTCVPVLLAALASILLYAWLSKHHPEKLRRPKKLKKRLWH